ncbi:hypothetical protein ACIBL8_48405 [Streptomyces sp. NPDC050523]|uniref:hypothetical protein n=1 Tax=Streptomyces sp. NPDC050523 TaxID=3365622 RepID=UPI0037BE0C5E
MKIRVKTVALGGIAALALTCAVPAASASATERVSCKRDNVLELSGTNGKACYAGKDAKRVHLRGVNKVYNRTKRTATISYAAGGHYFTLDLPPNTWSEATVMVRVYEVRLT